VTHLRACDYTVETADSGLARAFIRDYHYSKGCSNTHVYMHGLFKEGVLVGVAQWLPPTRVAAESVNPENWRRVIALSRLVIHPDVPTNGASFLLGRSIRLIKSEGKWVSLVTYADEFMKHSGAIYRATNWEFVGEMKGSPRWEDADGKQVSRKATKTRTNAEMRSLGLVNVGTFGKRKFVMHLNHKGY
jgi:hypothetical protein